MRIEARKIKQDIAAPSRRYVLLQGVLQHVNSDMLMIAGFRTRV